MKKFKVKYKVLNSEFDTSMVADDLNTLLITFATQYRYCKVTTVFHGKNKIYEDTRYSKVRSLPSV